MTVAECPGASPVSRLRTWVVIGTLLGEASRPAVRSGDADLCSIASSCQFTLRQERGKVLVYTQIGQWIV